MKSILFFLFFINVGLILGQTADDHYKKAIDYILSSEYKKSIDELNQAIKLNPSEGDYYFYRGCSYYDLKEYNLAITDLTQSLKMGLTHKTDISIAHLKLGKCRAELNDHKGAIKEFSMAIEQCIDSFYLKNYYLLRGISEMKLSMRLEACSDFFKAKELGHSEAIGYI